MKPNEKKTKSRLTIDMEPDLHRALKLRAVEEGVSMRDLLLRWIRQELAKSPA